MREIKFRGMGINGKWSYGNLSIIAKKFDHIEAGSYISNSVGVPFAYQVRPETVGQFTGLKDKDGKDIYEGDILHLSYDGITMDGYVKQEPDGTWIFYKDEGNFLEVFHNKNRVTIIGNIHEHQVLSK